MAPLKEEISNQKSNWKKWQKYIREIAVKNRKPVQEKQLEKESKEASKEEEKMDVQEELIAGMGRQLQTTDGKVEQHGERLNVLEQRADNQEQMIDELRPLTGML